MQRGLASDLFPHRAEDLPNPQYSTPTKQNPEFQTIQTYRTPELINAQGSTLRTVPGLGMTDLLCRNQECLLRPCLPLRPHPSRSMSRVTPVSRKSSLNSPVKLPTSQIYDDPTKDL